MGHVSRVLVIGLGSMGRRRIRNLKALGIETIAGYDTNPTRIDAAVESYSIRPFLDFEEALSEFSPDAILISTSPEHHMKYAFSALKSGIPCFIEASVVHSEEIAQLDRESEKKKVIMAPSCTMKFFQGPKLLKQLIIDEVIGRPISYTYATGQWLPDWHPWEDIADFYVSRRETGGCREIVPFELTWLNDLFGTPQPISCRKYHLSELNADIDDSYYFLLQHPGGLVGSLNIEVISRPTPTRELRVIGESGIIVMSGDEKCVRYSNIASDGWVTIPFDLGTHEGISVNPEEPYIAELNAFVLAVAEKNSALFPNTLQNDFATLSLLNKLDSLALTP